MKEQSIGDRSAAVSRQSQETSKNDVLGIEFHPEKPSRFLDKIHKEWTVLCYFHFNLLKSLVPVIWKEK